MILWESDTCDSCRWLYEVVDNVAQGQPETVACQYHPTFEDALAANRFKNYTIGTIQEALELTNESEKKVTFRKDGSGGVIFELHNFDQIDLDVVDGLNLNIVTELV